MKIAITYQYERGLSSPFKAQAYIGGQYILRLSEKSFSDARAQLVRELERQAKLPHVALPEDELIEIKSEASHV